MFIGSGREDMMLIARYKIYYDAVALHNPRYDLAALGREDIVKNIFNRMIEMVMR